VRLPCFAVEPCFWHIQSARSVSAIGHPAARNRMLTLLRNERRLGAVHPRRASLGLRVRRLRRRRRRFVMCDDGSDAQGAAPVGEPVPRRRRRQSEGLPGRPDGHLRRPVERARWHGPLGRPSPRRPTVLVPSRFPEIGTCRIPVEPADFHPGNSQAALCVGRMEKL